MGVDPDSRGIYAADWGFVIIHSAEFISGACKFLPDQDCNLKENLSASGYFNERYLFP